MAESAATPIDLDDTLPEGAYQIDPLFKAIVDGDLNGVKHWLQGFSVDCSNLLADCKFFWHPYLQKIVNAGGIKAYAKAHRQQLATMFVRTRCFPRVPDEIVPLIVDYVFHVGFY